MSPQFQAVKERAKRGFLRMQVVEVGAGLRFYVTPD
jgi:hypothetical protein